MGSRCSTYQILGFMVFCILVQGCSNSSDGFAPGTTNSSNSPSPSPSPSPAPSPSPGPGPSIYRNCQEILAANPSSTSGVYSISYDGTGSFNSTLSVYCNMTTNGGGWTLVMKQKANDGLTLQGDGGYFTSVSATTLNDVNANLGINDENLVTRAFQTVPVTQLMLAASNEATVQTNSVSATSALAAFMATPSDFLDDVNATRPNWFIRTSNYPNGAAITGSRFGFNIRQRYTNSNFCAARWGWTANQDAAGVSVGSSDSCGGLGAYGVQYGSSFMSGSKNIWQPATLFLYVK